MNMKCCAACDSVKCQVEVTDSDRCKKNYYTFLKFALYNSIKYW